MKLKSLALSFCMVACMVPVAASAASNNATSDVYYTWQGANGVRVYSDTSRLNADGVEKVENSTGFSSYVIPQEKKEVDTSKMSLEEQRLLVEKQILEKNLKEKQKLEMQATQERRNNCNIAKLNVQNIQQATRVNNKEQLLKQYEADVQRYCN